MKLVEAQVTLFRNIIDSTTVAIQPDVTCLVGKNESGKTASIATRRTARSSARPATTGSAG